MQDQAHIGGALLMMIGWVKEEKMRLGREEGQKEERNSISKYCFGVQT